MKKFLSLLLALTMVMSLVVVPARATETMTGASLDHTTLSVELGSTATLGVNLSGLKIGEDSLSDTTKFTVTQEPSIEFATSASGIATVAAVENAAQRATITPVAAGNANITATITAKYKLVSDGTDAQEKTATQVLTCAVTVNEDANTLFKNAVKSHIRYGTQTPSETSGTLTVYGYTGADWSVDAAAFGDYTSVAVDESNSNASKLIITGKKGSADVRAEFDVTIVPASFAIAATVSPVTAGGKTVLSVSNDNKKLPANVIYAWTYTNATNNSITGTIAGTGASVTWSVDKTLTAGNYTVTCTAKDGTGESAKTVATATTTVVVSDSKYALTSPAIGKQLSNDSATITLTPGTSFKFYLATDTTKAHVNGATYKYASSNSNIFTVTDAGVISVRNAGTANLTITASYQGVDYPVTVAVTVVNPTYTLGSTYCGYNNSSYIPSTLVSYANSALSAAGITGVTAGSVALSSASGNVVTAAGTAASGYTLTASATYLGTAELTATVTKATGGTFTMTFKVPVLPIPYSTSVIGTAYAEPYTTGSNYYYNTYRVTLPSTFNQYSVVSKNTSPNYNVSSAPTSGVTTVTLNQNEFVNGQCTLYVIAWNSNYNGYGYGYNYGTNYYGKYYSGAITVYQNSNDIEYTGVSGSTVNFAHSSFTAFMNSMNTASSSYYYQFEDVTFDYFSNSTQGTLYYGSTAMTSGSYSSSSYFNSATKITNLDNVSFAINSRIPSTVKEIVVPFKLHAKQYYNNNTYGTAVTFSGRVVISVAREDIVINVAAGDTVKLDASAFLSYLRASSTAYRNSNIDYVTFDQNISNSSNSSLANGALYTYYTNSYSFGSAVKSSDRFYYSSTAYNVSNLSDVAFRSNAYATAGTTVYIPFTIKLLNSNATVTGTLAAKISAAVNFYDVKASDYYYDAVKWAVGQGVAKGTGNNMFSPSKGCTRAEIVTFLWRAAGSKAPKSYSNRFTDVSSGMGSDFYNAILWAVGEGITTGTSTTTFSPNATCTRGQIVTFLHRYQKTPGGYYANSFKDVKSGDYCYNAVIWAYGSGVAKGTSNTTFSPNKTCTRGDAVTFLYRAIAK